MSDHGMVLVALSDRVVPTCLCGWAGANHSKWFAAQDEWRRHRVEASDDE